MVLKEGGHWALLPHTWVITTAKPFKLALLTTSWKYHFYQATSKSGVCNDSSLLINAVWVLMDGMRPVGSSWQESISKEQGQPSPNEGLSFLHCRVCSDYSQTWTSPTTIKSSGCSGCDRNISEHMFFQAFIQVADFSSLKWSSNSSASNQIRCIIFKAHVNFHQMTVLIAPSLRNFLPLNINLHRLTSFVLIRNNIYSLVVNKTHTSA